MNYLVSYDLNKSGKNYDGVYEAIKAASTGTWCRPLESVWIIQSNLAAEEIYNRIVPSMDSDDRVLVVEIIGNYCFYLDDKTGNYLKGML
jgi:hypothetical protein